MSIPRNDPELIAWGANAAARLAATPEAFGTTPQRAAIFGGLYADFLAANEAVVAALAAGTRSKSLTTGKNGAKALFLADARAMYTTVQADGAVSRANKELLAIHIRKAGKTPSPIPDVAPSIRLVSVSANTVVLRFANPANPTSRAMPRAVAGLMLFSAVGPTPPTSAEGWTFQMATGRNEVPVTFGPDVPPGARVHFTASYFNPRKATGPAATPLGVNIPGGGAPLLAA